MATSGAGTEPEALAPEAWEKLTRCAIQLQADLHDGPAWRFEKEVLPGVRVHSRGVEGTSLRLFRACGAVPSFTPTALAPYMWEDSQRMQWDSSYSGVEVIVRSFGGVPPVEGCADVVALQRLLIKPVLIISARDFCSLQLLRHCTGPAAAASGVGAPGCVYAVAFSQEHPRCPPDAGGKFVRGEILPGSAWHLAPLAADGSGPALSAAAGGAAAGGGAAAEGSWLSYFILTDLKGWVPAWAVNAGITDTLKTYFGCLRDFAAKRGSEGGAAGAAAAAPAS